MKVLEISTGYLLVLDRGEEILDRLAAFARERALVGGVLWGIGAVENPVLAYYDRNAKAYHDRRFEGIYEITNLTGNLAWRGDAVVVHAHMTVSGPNFEAWGGHLKEARIGVTGEIFLHPLDRAVRRRLNPDFNLPLIDLED